MENNYERKLELVRAIREENRNNEARMSHRENIFYGYINPDKQSIVKESGQEAEALPKHGNSLFIRTVAAVFLAIMIMAMGKDGEKTILGLTATEMKQYIREDFSKQVVDYLADFTYTLDYEKTSVKR